MKKCLMLLCAGVLALGLGVQDAEAKRLGGGAAKGMQRESVTPRQATPPAQATPQPTPQAPVATPPATAQPKRNWLGPLAGLAAGIGLAALLSHFGLGEGMANVLLLLLAGVAVAFVVKLLFRKPRADAATGDPLQFAGVGGPGMAPPPLMPGAGDSPQGSLDAPIAPVAASVPADFDQAAFLRVAKVNFIRLQAANDAGNLDDLREFTTPEMFAELRMDLSERRESAQETDVVSLDAELLEVLAEANRYIASVRFHGMIREENAAPAAPFDEVWHLVKPRDGSRGWAVAGIQPLN